MIAIPLHRIGVEGGVLVRIHPVHGLGADALDGSGDFVAAGVDQGIVEDVELPARRLVERRPKRAIQFSPEKVARAALILRFRSSRIAQAAPGH